jgi:predicted PurR-regulated permease PerM
LVEFNITEMQSQQRARIIFLLVLALITGWFSYIIVKPFLAPVIIALVFAIIFYPIHTRIQQVIGRQNLSALLSTLFVLLVIIIPTVILGSAISRELTAAYQSLNAQSMQDGGWVPYFLHLGDRVTAWLGRYIDVSQYNFRAELLSRLQQGSSFFLRRLAGAVGDLVGFAIDSVITFFTLFFLFRDGRAGYRRMAVMTPLRPAQVEKLTTEVSKAITASMYGGLVVALIQGILTGLAFWALGLASPVLWGIAAALFSFVPFVGSAAIWAPAAIFLMISGHWIKGLIMIGWGAGIVGMADNVIRPVVISGQVKFHPLYIFFALLGGVQAFGLLGLFVGPVVLAIAQSLFSLMREEIRETKIEEEAFATSIETP